MEQLILNIKNKSKIPFLRELLKRMEFVEVVEPKKHAAKTKKEKFLEEFKEAVEEVKQIKAGKLKGVPAKDLLDELWYYRYP